jgi:hypothetical protein
VKPDLTLELSTDEGRSLARLVRLALDDERSAVIDEALRAIESADAPDLDPAHVVKLLQKQARKLLQQLSKFDSYNYTRELESIRDKLIPPPLQRMKNAAVHSVSESEVRP